MEERLEGIDDEKEQLMAEVREEMEEEGVDEPDQLETWDSYDEQFSDLEDEATELAGQRWKFMEAVVDWMTDVDIQRDDPDDEEVREAFGEVESCEFVIQELSFGQVEGIGDDVADESFDLDVEKQDVEGTPRQGYYKILTLQEAIDEWPEGSPTQSGKYHNEKPSPGDYPHQVADWMFDKVDAFNTTQETELGNSSLKEELKKSKK